MPGQAIITWTTSSIFVSHNPHLLVVERSSPWSTCRLCCKYLVEITWSMVAFLSLNHFVASLEVTVHNFSAILFIVLLVSSCGKRLVGCSWFFSQF